MSRETQRHLERVRERFTRTAEEFARFALAARSEEADRLTRLAAPRGDELALDVACGPGTFTRAFARHVRFTVGLDLTPAMLAEARTTAARAGLTNIGFARGDANALPLADGALDLAICAYSFHHFLDPAGTLRELSRVVRRGGRVAVVDIIVPDGGDAELNNRIERARDASHAATLARAELAALFDFAGLQVLASELTERTRSFDDWVRVAGLLPGSPAYVQTHRLMEASLPGDTAGFHPRRSGAQGELEFVQTSALIVAEKR